MNNGLNDVISAAVRGITLNPAKENSEADPSSLVSADMVFGAANPLRRRGPRLAPEGDFIDPGNSNGRAAAGLPLEQHNGVGAQPAAVAGTVPVVPAQRLQTSSDALPKLGEDGFRLAFWLCGFHDALTERQSLGEPLTENEKVLLRLSSADFPGMRPVVVDMTLGRLDALVHSPEMLVKAAGPGEPGPTALEVFALTTLRSLSEQANQMFREEGPDAAMALFGETSSSVMKPLAIFQLVFTAALELVEAFKRVISTEAKLLNRLAEALDSEVERI